MAIDLCKYELKAKRCPQSVLADVFIGLLGLVKELITSNQVAENRVEQILSIFESPCDVKATVKRKAPAKKKATAVKPSVTAATVYTPLFWVPTSGDPVTLKDLRDELLPLDCRDSTQYLGGHILPIADYIDAPHTSVYHVKFSEREQSFIEQASRYYLGAWFIKTKGRSKTNDEPKGPSKPPAVVLRPSLLGPSYAQRFGILIYTLKKACGINSTIEDVENAILKCSIGENEVGLLSESLQTVHDNDELKDALGSIEKFMVEKPIGELYDDERFLYFISRIPNFRERMYCLYVSHTFKSVAAQLCTRMEEIRTALTLLVLNPRIHMLHRLLLEVGNELNKGHPSRSGLKYFRLSTFDKLSDVKGKDGMSLSTYLAHFMDDICENDEERKFLQKVAQYGVLTTYQSTKDLINTYLIMSGMHKNSAVVPRNSAHYTSDEYEHVIECAAKSLLPEACLLVDNYHAFLATYTGAAYFFGDPNTVLPLDHPQKCADDDSGPTRDLIQRYLGVIQTIKPPKRRQFDVNEKYTHQDVTLNNPVTQDCTTNDTLKPIAVATPISDKRTPLAKSNRTPLPAQTARFDDQGMNMVAKCTENVQPSQKRVKTTASARTAACPPTTAFAPAMVNLAGPSSRRLLTLRGRMGIRGAIKIPAPPPVQTQSRPEISKVRTSISNSYSLARDLNHPAPEHLDD